MKLNTKRLVCRTGEPPESEASMGESRGQGPSGTHRLLGDRKPGRIQIREKIIFEVTQKERMTGRSGEFLTVSLENWLHLPPSRGWGRREFFGGLRPSALEKTEWEIDTDHLIHESAPEIFLMVGPLQLERRGLRNGSGPVFFFGIVDEMEKQMFRKALMLVAATLISAHSLFAMGHGGKNLVEVAVGAGSFNTLVAAAQAAGLADTLANGGPFTVFAPTDAAFAALPEGTVENLLKPENQDQLKSILLYHVLDGKVMSSAVVGKSLSPATLNGQTFDVKTQMGKVMVNDAQVTQTDIEASNGVIHVIDKVILPSS